MDMNRDLKLIRMIILHCSDTDLPEFDNIETINKWHRAKGWRMVGYHNFVDKRGHIFEGRPLTMVGAHCSGQNMGSIGICLSGKKIFYDEQFRAAWFLIKDYMARFKIPRSQVYPHHHFNPNKTCPNFELSKIWQFDNDIVS